MAEIIILIIVMIPLYVVLAWTYFCPEDSILFGKRWMYTEEPELSKEVVGYTKFASLISMIGLPIILIGFIFNIAFLKFTLVLLPLVIIIGALKIFTDDKNS